MERKRLDPGLPFLRPKRRRNKRPDQPAPTCERPTKPVGPNKITILAKDAILLGIQKFGSDGKGSDGIVGFVYHLCKKHPLAAASLLGRVIPMHVTLEDKSSPLTKSIIEELQKARHERELDNAERNSASLH